MKVVLVTCVLLGSAHSLSFSTHQAARAGVVHRTISTGHKISLTFIGTVKSVEPFGRGELIGIPVDFDPRFAVTVQIESVTSQVGPLEAGTERVFAIHSPTRLFDADIEDVILKKYRFRVIWQKSGNKARFSGLTASVIEDKAVLSR